MSQIVQTIAPSALKLHPRNEEFFSNAEGEDFKRLKESIAEQGILTPLRVSADMVIVSGHQRWRAATELNMPLIPVIVDGTLLDEDDKLVQLIASNFGRMKNDPVKQGRWIKEYERLRGVKRGNNQHTSFGNNFRPSQDDIAKELGVDTRTLRNLKQLSSILPEFQEIISEGRINATTGFKLIARLSMEEQQQLLEALPEAQKFTQKQVEEYVNRIHGLETKVAALTAEKDKMAETVVEAQKVVNNSADATQYLAMQTKMKKAQEDYRAEFEAHRVLKTNVKEVNRKTKEEIDSLKAQLQKAQEDVQRASGKVEVVYPPDYEELKYKAEQYDSLVSDSINEREIKSFNTPEQQQRDFEVRFEQEVEGFLSAFSGLLLEADGIRSMSGSDKSRYGETLGEIIRIAEAMLKIMNERKEVA